MEELCDTAVSQNLWQERLKSTLTAGEQVCLQGAEGVQDHHLCTERKTFKSEFEEMPQVQNENFGSPARGRHDS